MTVRAEFTIYPFQEGEDPPGYVQAAIGELRTAGFQVEVGLLGQAVSGDMDRIVEAFRIALPAAMRAGANRVVISVEDSDDGPR
jgi:uncharacterized protein YqgV (UPF0045/DUF77 family)